MINKSDLIKTFESALDLYNQGNLSQALHLCEYINQSTPDFPAAWHLAGNILYDQGQMEPAVTSLRKAVKADPFNLDSLNQLALAYFRLFQLKQCERVIESILSLDRNDISARMLRGRVLLSRENWSAALSHYEQLKSLLPNEPAVFIGLLYCHSALMNWDKVISTGKQLLQLAPDEILAFAYMSAAYERQNCLDEAVEKAEEGLSIQSQSAALKLIKAKCLRRLNQGAEAVDLLESIDLGEADATTAIAIDQQLGQLYDQSGDFDRAWKKITSFNHRALKQWRDSGKKGRRILEGLNRLYDAYHPDWIAQWNCLAPLDTDVEPIFLVGFPRSGTTMLDNILDSHSDISVIEEEEILFPVVHDLQRSPNGYPGTLATINQDLIDTLRRQYFGHLEALNNKSSASFVVDKFPLNIHHIGLIHRLFPRSKIILAIRHPLDCCLSAYMQNFSLNDAMACFLTMETTIELYEKTMRHWQQVNTCLPITYHQVRYEDVLEQPETEIRALLDFLGLEWQEQMLRFNHHASKRNIKTPSYHQVSKEFYLDARYRWKNYQAYLRPFREKLQPFINYFGYQ
jgi:tetratricopeptide (TPR) repeat protein